MSRNTINICGIFIVLALSVSIVITGYMDNSYRPQGYSDVTISYNGNELVFAEKSNVFIDISKKCEALFNSTKEDLEYLMPMPCQDSTANWERRKNNMWIEFEIKNEKYKRIMFVIDEKKQRQEILVFCAKYSYTYNGGDLHYYNTANVKELTDTVKLLF